MIDVHDLTKAYDGVEALRGVSFSVKSGEIIGLLGPNGAGKTTLMKILTGYLHPSAGTVTVGGLDVLTESGRVQEMIGYLPENAPLYPELTVQSQLRMMAELRRIPAGQQAGCLSDAIRAVGLEERLTRPIATLSKGYRQRVGLAQAILHRPKLLILDEPTNGLDPAQIVEVRHLIRKLADHCTVVLSTHILSEVEATCDRAIIIMAGEVKADARLADLASGADVVVGLTLASGEEEGIRRTLATLDHVRLVTVASRATGDKVLFRVKVEQDRDICPAIYQQARQNDWQLCELRQETRTLEAVFNQLTGTPGGAK
ncbi:MAG: ABC transporter ATP-binding protein [Proteobacteria bacterium]|nr:ABC transporter ATP-binding protein [Pseudomonadota bacterium]MBU1688489.1 ABC transporter ATP-binding protein [Pseudomonadota bacterium]